MWFQNIKVFLSDYMLKKDVSKQKRKLNYITIQSADSIGIILNIDDRQQYNDVMKYNTKLASKNKDVSLLFYSNTQEIPNYFVNQPVLITKKEINFLGKPDEKIIERFINRNFDYLLDFTTTDYITTTYIFAMAKAHAKVTKSVSKNVKYADIIFDLNPDNNFEAMTKAIDIYLNIPNK